MDYIKAPKFKAANNLLFTTIINSRVSELLRLIQDKEVDLNCRNINDSTPLHAACSYKLDNIVPILLSYGSDPNAVESYHIGGKSPLHIAVENDCYEICRMLLDSGASPNIRDKFDQPP